MLHYVAEALICFQHNDPQKQQDKLHPHIKPKYEANVQYSKEEDSSSLLGKYEKRFIQEVTGTFLYY